MPSLELVARRAAISFTRRGFNGPNMLTLAFCAQRLSWFFHARPPLLNYSNQAIDRARRDKEEDQAAKNKRTDKMSTERETDATTGPPLTSARP